MSLLPFEIWLIIFEDVSDHDTLWSVARNISRYLRACVDEYFRRTVLRSCIIDLTYSTIHSLSGPNFCGLYVPMEFDRLSEDGSRAVFRQVQHKDHALGASYEMKGSLRGWVPFIERYCLETLKSAPLVLNKTKSAPGPVLWEQDYRSFFAGSRNYQLRKLRDHTSIGRGDQPPYFIRLPPYLHDTELVDLSIDCSAREISLDWRRTLSAFFLEQHFIALARQNPENRRVYDTALISANDRVRLITHRRSRHAGNSIRHFDDWRRARRKRLQTWVKKNAKRMSAEHRLMTEDIVAEKRYCLGHEACFQPENLVEIHDEDAGVEELVPDKCAKDWPRLMKWPDGRRAFEQAEKEVKVQRCTCVVL
jgi:hypothetical protein